VLLAGSVLTAAMAVTSASSGATNLQMFEWTGTTNSTASWSDGSTNYSGDFNAFFTTPSNVDYSTLSWMSGYTFTSTTAFNATTLPDQGSATVDFPATFPLGITGLVLFVNNLGANEGLQIDGGNITSSDITVLGKADTVTQSGVQFTTTGTTAFSNGFALQINVPISQLQFTYITQGGGAATIGMGLQAAATGVPGAGIAGLATFGLAGISRRRRR